MGKPVFVKANVFDVLLCINDLLESQLMSQRSQGKAKLTELADGHLLEEINILLLKLVR